MTDRDERKPFRVVRGLFRLWVVGATIWVSAVSFAFWSGNGGAGARWVWDVSPAERAAMNAPQWKTYNIPPVYCPPDTSCAPVPTPLFNASLLPPPVIVSDQVSVFLPLALLPPVLVLALGGSLVWAAKGFRKE